MKMKMKVKKEMMIGIHHRQRIVVTRGRPIQKSSGLEEIQGVVRSRVNNTTARIPREANIPLQQYNRARLILNFPLRVLALRIR